MKVKDHNGKEYRSLALMCDLYGIWETTFRNRKAKGWSLKDCLTFKPAGYTDHEGNHFDTIREMAAYWKMPEHRLEVRLSRGWSIKDAVTRPYYQRTGLRHEQIR